MMESMLNEASRRTRGGRRPGAGRPPAYREPLVRKTVTLPVSYVEQLTVFGAGNLSLMASAYWPKPRTPTLANSGLVHPVLAPSCSSLTPLVSDPAGRSSA